MTARRPRRILFFTHHPGYVRTYEATLRELLAEGHHVHVAYTAKVKTTDGKIADRMADEHGNLTLERVDKPERGPLDLLRRGLRLLADYSRYQHPRYADAHALRARAASKLIGKPLDKGVFFAIFFRLYLPTLGRIRSAAYADRVGRWALALADVLPAPRRPTEWIRAHEPDVVLVSPLVGLGAGEAEYLDAARALRIPSALLVASWDNLTNKGLVKSPTDRVVVWNAAQRDELIDLHGTPAERVVTTGAQRFDDWFEMAPSMTHEAFCAHVGLDPDRPFVLYLCSSPFIAPHEVPFVRRFVKTLRAADGPLGDVGVLVRPHPQNAKQWLAADLSDFDNVTIWPRAGEQPLHGAARSGFYDSMALSMAVVGINTSAQIEAGIVGKTVHTVRDAAFAGTQDGTLHFRHLLVENGGLLHVADDLHELVAALERVRSGEIDAAQTQRFVERFVRPHGLDRPASPIVAQAIRDLLHGPAESVVPRRRPTVLQHLQIWPLAALCVPFSVVELRASVRRGVQSLADAVRRRPAVPPLVRGGAARTVQVLAWDGDRAAELLYWIPYVRRRLQAAPIGARIIIHVADGDPRWYAPFGAEIVRDEPDAPTAADVVISPADARVMADGLRGQRAAMSVYPKNAEPRALCPPAAAAGPAFSWEDLEDDQLTALTGAGPATFVLEQGGDAYEEAVVTDAASLTDAIERAEVVVTSDVAAAALGVFRRRPTCLVATTDPASAGDLDVLDRVALGLGVDAIVLDPTALRAMVTRLAAAGETP